MMLGRNFTDHTQHADRHKPPGYNGSDREEKKSTVERRRRIKWETTQI